MYVFDETVNDFVLPPEAPTPHVVSQSPAQNSNWWSYVQNKIWKSPCTQQEQKGGAEKTKLLKSRGYLGFYYGFYP